METTHTIQIKLVVFSVIEGSLSMYVSSEHLPHVVVRKGKKLEDELNSLIQTIGFSPKEGFIEQLYTLSDIHPDENIVFVVYYLLVADRLIPKELRRAFVHRGEARVSEVDAQILDYAIQRLRWKIEYTNVVYSLLPLDFTLGELQRVYEAILSRVLDKRNFRKKILSLNMLTDTGTKKIQGRARPAEVYRFAKRVPSIVEIL